MASEKGGLALGKLVGPQGSGSPVEVILRLKPLGAQDESIVLSTSAKSITVPDQAPVPQQSQEANKPSHNHSHNPSPTSVEYQFEVRMPLTIGLNIFPSLLQFPVWR